MLLVFQITYESNSLSSKPLLLFINVFWIVPTFSFFGVRRTHFVINYVKLLQKLCREAKHLGSIWGIAGVLDIWGGKGKQFEVGREKHIR